MGLAYLYKWEEMRGGGAALAQAVGARAIQPHSADAAERRLLNVVEEMAIASGVPVPSVHVIDEEGSINAFAAGQGTADAAVVVTRGASASAGAAAHASAMISGKIQGFI